MKMEILHSVRRLLILHSFCTAFNCDKCELINRRVLIVVSMSHLWIDLMEHYTSIGVLTRAHIHSGCVGLRERASKSYVCTNLKERKKEKTTETALNWCAALYRVWLSIFALITNITKLYIIGNGYIHSRCILPDCYFLFSPSTLTRLLQQI